jgi:CheY-like chemotaxis protein
MPKRILVIEDDPMARIAIVQILKVSGYEVIEADNGRRGIELFEGEAPDLVVTDIIMPEKEGLETIMHLRGLRPGQKIIAISGGGRLFNTDFLQMASRLGADAILAKPFEPEELIDKIEACFAA